MAYNSRNKLNKIIEIQGLVLDAQRKGITQKFVYDSEVQPHYHISYSCFNNYLAINAKRELELLNKKEAEAKRQLTIEF